MGFDTLIIKHLPPSLNVSERIELLECFGALEVKCLTSFKNIYNVAFARFKNEPSAELALLKLHQLNVLGSYLSVEFARGPVPDLTKEEPVKAKEEVCDKNEEYLKQFVDKLNSWHSPVDFKHVVPSHLQYQYPPPTPTVLLNIARLLATVPKLYTQVLHLMNKMNLPCPFTGEVLPDLDIGIFFPSQEIIPKQTPVENIEEPKIVQSSTESESEISSEEEVSQSTEIIPDTPKTLKKSVKRPKFVKPTAPTRKRKLKQKLDDVFEKIDTKKEQKKIKLSQPAAESLAKPVEDIVKDVSGFGLIHPVNKTVVEEEPPKSNRDEREEERLEKEEIVCISSRELAQNRISPKDQGVIPAFKNYTPGAPSCRLYVKNVAKAVTPDYLKYIYTKYIDHDAEEPVNMFDVRLMTEGRMKGQAFITLQNVELAKKALEETNGFILKDKPLVVQFARSATK